MALKKQTYRENTEVSAESEQHVASDKDEMHPSVAARETRHREREHRTKNKDMTEDEMMALALRLSEQEAKSTAQRLQEEEEEAVRKAIEDSMFGESSSRMDTPAHLCLSSRRKLVYLNGDSQKEVQGQTAAGHVTRTRKWRRVEDSPLKEMPDLSQTQPSPGRSEATASGPQSPQSCDSSQMEEHHLPPFAVVPKSLAQVQIQIPRLNQDLLDSHTASGFVSAMSICPQSPTFLKRPENLSEEAANPQPEKTQPELSPEQHTSPVFGLTEKCASTFKEETLEVGALPFSSKESYTSSYLEEDAGVRKSRVLAKAQMSGLDLREWLECHSPVFEADIKNVTSSEEEQSLSQAEPNVDMRLHWSEEDEDDSVTVNSPSPVFPEEKRVLQTVNDNRSHCRSSQSASLVSDASAFSGRSVPQSTVHYYWGVPFCPKGLDPDLYTKVILAQMELYEKNLKMAQRSLLNKVAWGEPVLPQPDLPQKSPSSEVNSPQTLHQRSRRLRGKAKERDSEDEMEETQTSQKRLWEEEQDLEEGDNVGGLEEEDMREEEENEGQFKKETHGEDLREESDCEVCPETQLSDDLTQDLTSQDLSSQLHVRSPHVEMIDVDFPKQRPQTPENDKAPEQEEKPESSDVSPLDQDLGDPQCQLQSTQSPLWSQPADPDQNLKQNFHMQDLMGPDPTVPDPDSASDVTVQCPLCQRSFPSEHIEMHAAYCDGTTSDKVSTKQRRKRPRRGDSEDGSHSSTNSQPSAAQAQEKCYICLKAIPLRDYMLHTDECLLRPRIGSAGRLLSALDRSEPNTSDAGPSGSTAPPQVISLVDDDDNSPVPSFTSISNAQDCLLDFGERHRGKRPGPRGGTKQRSKRR